MNADDTGLVIGLASSGAEALAVKVPKAHVVAAFQTVPSEVLFGVFEGRRKRTRPSLFYCGDEESSKETVAGLIRDVGFEPLNAGPLRMARYCEPFALRMARYCEPFALLMAEVAYEGEKGPEVAYRLEWLGE
jgi:predicted dinucleotide-binding enzyme